MAVGFVASATSGSQASVSTFNIGTLGTGARAGIVFVATHGSAALDTGHGDVTATNGNKLQIGGTSAAVINVTVT